MQVYKTIIFDLGAVLIDWNPDYLYRKLITNDQERKWFLENICTPDWNEEQDSGRPLNEATETLIEKYPGQETMIRAYYERWEEMLNGPIEGTLEILRLLKERNKVELIALTNWSSETFPIALEKYDFLHWFNGRVVSGEEKTRKPFKVIYETLIKRYSVIPSEAIFIDDNKRNLIPAEELGITALHFTSPERLQKDLWTLRIL
jgi:2-haloacid dehalogenase